jgi:hypothetical protein
MKPAVQAALLLACIGAVPTPAFAWDYPGHRIVGAIADAVLSANQPEVYKKIFGTPRAPGKLAAHDSDGNVLLRTLRDVAVYPDCAKSGNVPYCGRVPSKEEVAYAARNAHNDSYHYTDVPVQQPKYLPDSPGTEKTDVVQMINYVIAQLRGKKPHIDGVNLTDAEAVWLLAHLVGDIHQPLHVGAAYYDKETCAKLIDPNTVADGLKGVASTNGGNFISLSASAPAPAAPPAGNLHLYWDSVTVNRAMQEAGLSGAEQDFARLLASDAPPNWQTTGDAETWAAQWASEVIATANDAYDRSDIAITGTLDAGKCQWKAKLDPAYQAWAQGVAHEQLKKAGFRLAALLTAIFVP